MITGFKKSIILFTICILSVQPAHACWNDAANNALKIKHLNTMLMATALRCRNTVQDFLPEYNAFVLKHNALLGEQNNIVRMELAKTLGDRGAIAESDNLSVGYANTYGAGHPAMDCAQLRMLAIDVGAQPSDPNYFAALGDSILLPAKVPGSVCRSNPSKIASK